MKRKLLCMLAVIMVVALSLIIVSCGDENKTEIETQGLLFEDNLYRITVSSQTQSFDILSKIKFNKDAEFVLSKDKDFSKTFTEGKLELVPGDNVVYLKVTDDNDNESTYTFNIYKKKSVTVTFNPNGGSMSNTSITVEEGTIISAPSAERIGHTLSWDYDFTKPLTSNTVINAVWTPYDCVISADVDGNITRYEVQFGKVPSIAEPNKLGYKFTGWKYGNETFNPNAEFNIAKEAISIVATFEPIVYEIQYVIDNNFVTNSENNVSTFTIETENGEVLAITIYAPVHSSKNYEFMGWYTDSVFTNKLETIDESVLRSLDGNKITLYPKWKIHSHVTYNLAGGECAKTEDNFVVGEQYSLPVPERANYVFNGWSLNGQIMANSGKWTFAIDVELVAEWTPRQNDITYVLGYENAVNNENNPDSFDVEDESIELLPATYDEKHLFLGWYTDPSCEEQYLITHITSDMVGQTVALYAKWQVTSTVSFNANGGNCDEESRDIIVGTAYELPTPTRDRYRFDGWYYGDVLIVLSGEWTYQNDVELVAKWTPLTYNIGYELNGGAFDDGKTYPTSFTVESLAEELILNSPTKQFSTFVGWYLDKDFEQLIEAIDPLEIDYDITLYAKFDTATVTINYDAKGGSILKTQDMFELGVDFTLQPTTKPGYRFDGWFFGEELFTATTWTDITVTEVNLVAHWTLIEYEITYDLAGASGENINFVYKYNVNSNDITLPVLTKDGSHFAGWALNGGSPNKTVVIAKGSTGNRAYTAVWASDKDSNGLLYSMVDDKMVVVGIDRTIDSKIKNGIKIPSTHGGKPVVAIDTGAFEEFGKAFTKTSYANMSDSYVTFSVPTSVKRIGANAFAECNGIKVVLYDPAGGEADYEAWDEGVSWEAGNISARDCIWGFRPAIGWTRYSMVDIPDDYE